MTHAHVRLATADDASAIATIHIGSWQATYRGLVPDSILDGFSLQRRVAGWREAIEREARQLAADPATETGRTWVVEAKDRIVGFAASGPGRAESAPPPDGAGEVYAIYLAPGSSGKGYGRTLFATVVQDLHRRAYDPIVVWVFEANPVARRFYEAAGFRADGARSAIDFDGTPIGEIRYRLDKS